jgi:hypothetical protein
MTDMMDVQPLDLSVPTAKYWLTADRPASSDMADNGEMTVASKMSVPATAAAYSKLSVAIPRRYSNCSDNVSFADSSDRSPSISPAASNSGERFRPAYHHLSDSEFSSSPGGSDSEADRVPSPLVLIRPGTLAARSGPATKRFLSKYITEQVGKLFFSRHITLLQFIFCII